LREFVAHRLATGQWSPEQISNVLKVEFRDDPSMRVSPETIYQALYVQSRGALKRELTTHLRTRRQQPCPRTNTQIPTCPDQCQVSVHTVLNGWCRGSIP